MTGAVDEYARHRSAPDTWALGRFVVPIGRWNELESFVGRRGETWPVSLLAGCSDAKAIAGLIGRGSPLVVEAVECKAENVANVDGVAEIVKLGLDVYVEAAPGVDFTLLAEPIHSVGAAGKIRTGGVTASAFPSSTHILHFLRACRQAGIRFKATAGLHHAVRGEYNLTYEPSPPTGTMFGYLNIAVAAALVWFGTPDEEVLSALEEASLDAFEFSDDGVRWRQHAIGIDQLAEVRREFFVGFGSCSFREPMSEIGLEAVPRS